MNGPQATLAPPRPRPSLTVAVAVAAVLLTLATGFGRNGAALAPWLIELGPPEAGMPALGRGELWRLFTPALLHFSLLHLVFNLAAWWSLAGAIERLQGRRRLAWLALLLTPTSNFGQYLADGPLFGGLSGLIFGLAGYVMAYGRLQPRSPLRLPRQGVILLLGWYALCWTGWLGPIANIGHTVGLLLGLAAGAAAALIESPKSRPR